MYQNIFDTHAHYDDDRFREDRQQILSALPQKGVCGVLNAACDLKSCVSSLALAREYPFVHAAVGIHPQAAGEYNQEALEQLALYAKEPGVAAIGEIGLDYHYDDFPKLVQKRAFAAQLALAKELGLPVIVHDREAHGDVMEMLRKYRPKGILHCFSGSPEMAAEAVGMGLYIAFGGAVTFKNARKAVEAAAVVPEDRLLVETDCPYMAPEPFRGKRCDSSLIAYTAQRLAQIRGTDPQKLLDRTCQNAKEVYNLT